MADGGEGGISEDAKGRRLAAFRRDEGPLGVRGVAEITRDCVTRLVWKSASRLCSATVAGREGASPSEEEWGWRKCSWLKRWALSGEGQEKRLVERCDGGRGDPNQMVFAAHCSSLFYSHYARACHDMCLPQSVSDL